MAFKLLVRSRETLIYEGECTSVTSLNDIGEFDVLENHANFITLIQKFLVIDKNMPEEQKISISKGVMSANEAGVEVYIQE